MPSFEIAQPQQDFPKEDSAISTVFIKSLDDQRSIEEAHHLAEAINALYAVGHPSIEATLRRAHIDTKSQAAFMSGIRAYEALGAFIILPARHARYTANETNEVMGELWDTENFSIDFIEQLEIAYRNLREETPMLADAVAEIARVEIDDPSKELLARAHMGAGAMRALQLDIDGIFAFEDELSALGS